MSETNCASTSCSAVIFLDFDGVIQTLRGALADGLGFSRSQSDPLLVAVLRRVCETGIRIVVSSTWRVLGQRAPDKLKENGLFEFLHEDWRTIDRFDDGQSARPKEIAEWLSRHPEVTAYRILDDDLWKWTPDQNAMWIQCHPHDGMPAQGMLKLLNFAHLPLRQNTQSNKPSSD